MIPIVAALLQQGLPLIANAFLSKGKDWVKEKTGVDLATATLSPDQVLSLRQAEMTHEVELLRVKQEDNQLAATMEQAYLADKQNARGMQMAALAQDDQFSKRFVYYFAMAWSVATAAYIAAITFCTIPANNVRFADTILGFMLGTLIATIIQFFYGGSKSGDKANEVMQKQVVVAAIQKGQS